MLTILQVSQSSQEMKVGKKLKDSYKYTKLEKIYIT